MWISQLPLVNLLQFWKGLPTPNCHQATKTVLILHFRGMICRFGMWCSKGGRNPKVKLVLLLARVVGMRGWKDIYLQVIKRSKNCRQKNAAWNEPSILWNIREGESSKKRRCFEKPEMFREPPLFNKLSYKCLCTMAPCSNFRNVG